jgi:hypothetical protein
MTEEWERTGALLKAETVLQGWDSAAEQDFERTAVDLAHAILFGKAQSGLEAVAAGGAGLTAAHARAIHFANEMAQLRHYRPLIAVEHGLPVLAPGVRRLIEGFEDLGLWKNERSWDL